MVFLYLYSWGSSEHHKIKVVNTCLHATCSFPLGGDSLALAIMIPRKQSQMVTLPISRQQKGLASFIFANLQVYNQAQGVMSLREKGRLIRKREEPFPTAYPVLTVLTITPTADYVQDSSAALLPTLSQTLNKKTEVPEGLWFYINGVAIFLIKPRNRRTTSHQGG